MPNANTPDEMRLALTVYASQNGRADLVEPMLKDLKLSIPLKRLRSWVYRDRRDEYEQIKQEYDAYVRSQAVDGFRAVASLATEVSGEAMRQLNEALKRGEVSLKELPKAAASAMVTAGIATDKGELLSGNPTTRVAHDVDDLTRDLASVGITIVMPGAEDTKALDDQRTPALPAGTD
jgi:hypothetical protein